MSGVDVESDTFHGEEGGRREDPYEDTNFTIPDNPPIVAPQWQLPPRTE